MNRTPHPPLRSRTPMVTEEGIIEAATPQKAVVRMKKNSNCHGCNSRGACGALNEKEMKLEVSNSLNAKVGDRVEISVPTRFLLKVSFFVYFCPILALLIGALIGDLWAKAHEIESSLLSILTGAGAMGIAYWVLKKMDRFAKSKEEYSPFMTGILVNEDLPHCGDNISDRTVNTASPQ
jgi:sigma-E factor negative regulatory protein RseC